MNSLIILVDNVVNFFGEKLWKTGNSTFQHRSQQDVHKVINKLFLYKSKRYNIFPYLNSINNNNNYINIKGYNYYGLSF